MIDSCSNNKLKPFKITFNYFFKMLQILSHWSGKNLTLFWRSSFSFSMAASSSFKGKRSQLKNLASPHQNYKQNKKKLLYKPLLLWTPCCFPTEKRFLNQATIGWSKNHVTNQSTCNIISSAVLRAAVFARGW